MNKAEIIAASNKIFGEFSDYCLNVSDEIFFRQPKDKWSIAQNVDHIVISTKQTKLAYSLPKFIIRLYTGKPNRPSRNYDELVKKYLAKLEAGGKASGIFIPKPISDSSKENLINKWMKISTTYLQILESNWKEDQLDNYLAPHPLLGKITLRELCYFTIYHTEHHLNIIKLRNQ
jgi:hypothetical protein